MSEWRSAGGSLARAALLVLPVAAGQAVMAWLSTFVDGPDDEPIEEAPHSILGYFFATFVYGTRQQCSGKGGCTLCMFPAGPVILHVSWRAIFLLALWSVASVARAAGPWAGAAGAVRRARVCKTLVTLAVLTGDDAFAGMADCLRGDFIEARQRL